MKNIYNKTLKICSKKPITGYSRDGYCKPVYGDIGNHLICAKTDKQFLDYTATKGNNLYSVIKSLLISYFLSPFKIFYIKT